MKMYVKADQEFTEDPFLATEHALDTTIQEADKAMRLFRSHKSHVPEDVMREVSENCYRLQKKIRRVRSLVYGNIFDEDTYETMLEDNSRYLED